MRSTGPHSAILATTHRGRRPCTLMFMHLTIALALLARPRIALAQSQAPKVSFTDYRLANGLRVLYCIDHNAPVVAVSVTYNVGSRNEVKGRTGFAHLFEHMMFQGSANVGKGEHMLLVQDNGGTMNGTTNKDRTNYFETVPANQMDLALFLESDRMRALDITEQNLENQRQVVKEERRQSYDNQPFGHVSEAIDELAFDSFAYKHSTIGSMSDLDAATLDDVKGFFKTYYAPNNAVLAVVGDFDEKVLKAKIDQYFAQIPRQDEPPAVEFDEHLNRGEKRTALTDNLARVGRFEAAYKTVDGANPDSYPLQVLSRIMSGGRLSRLYKAVVDQKLALNANMGGQFGRGPSLFSVTATVPDPANFAKVEAAVDAEISKLQSGGVTSAELERAKTQLRAATMIGGGGGRRGGGGGGANTALGRANALTQNAVYFNDPDRINNNLTKLCAVTADDIKRVANLYLNKQNRVVLTVAPADTGLDTGF